jgi:hypothetical protein
VNGELRRAGQENTGPASAMSAAPAPRAVDKRRPERGLKTHGLELPVFRLRLPIRTITGTPDTANRKNQNREHGGGQLSPPDHNSGGSEFTSRDLCSFGMPEHVGAVRISASVCSRDVRLLHLWRCFCGGKNTAPSHKKARGRHAQWPAPMHRIGDQCQGITFCLIFAMDGSTGEKLPTRFGI